MYRERISRKERRDSSYRELNTDVDSRMRRKGRRAPSEILNGKNIFRKCTQQGKKDQCGKEAACQIFNDNTSHCVCPHDFSLPDLQMMCTNRSTAHPTATPAAIPLYINSTSSTIVLPKSDQVEVSHTKGLEANMPMLSLILIPIFGLVFFFVCRRRWCSKKVERETLNLSPLNLKKSLLLANKYTPNPQYFGCTPPEVPILRRDNLSFMYDIGEGCFGKVYKGELCHPNSKEIVAVKVLKDSASREAEEDFMREVEIMSTFRHDNILSLIGVVLRDSGHAPWMVFEYMPYGDLAEVLRSNSRQLRNQIPGLDPLNKHSLHWITIQIAAGMTYLSAQRFVHRDLACRNCLVGLDLIVKIADFGMSRDVYTCDYYKIGGSRMLPVRWMSPESVIYGRFTLESDVWSFGVVLWEVYSYGKQPYYGHNNEEVVKLILQGIMLIPPEDCPPYVCKIMAECWKTEARDRLKFPEILERLEKTHEVSEKNEKGSLPRPPRGPVTIRTPDVLDTEGYLIPAPAPQREYLQPLPPIHSF